MVALRRGAAPEIVTEGVTGYLADTLEELAQVLPAAMALDPARCRAAVAARFDRPVIAQHLATILAATLAETEEYGTPPQSEATSPCAAVTGRFRAAVPVTA